MKGKINIIIAEDQDFFIEMIVPVLGRYGINTIGQASQGFELLELLKNKTPEIILLDIQMPEMDGGEALSIIKKSYPNIKVVILTSFLEECIREDFILRGADGFLTKREKLDVIIQTIKDVKKNKHAIPVTSQKSKFTGRELQMIPMMCAGDTMKDIANKLGITEKTAEGHRQRLYKKTNSTTKAGFIKFCIENGLNYLSIKKSA